MKHRRRRQRCVVCNTLWHHLSENQDGHKVCNLCVATGLYSDWLQDLEDEENKEHFKGYKSPFETNLADNPQFDHDVFMDFVNRYAERR